MATWVLFERHNDPRKTKTVLVVEAADKQLAIATGRAEHVEGSSQGQLIANLKALDARAVTPPAAGSGAVQVQQVGHLPDSSADGQAVPATSQRDIDVLCEGSSSGYSIRWDEQPEDTADPENPIPAHHKSVEFCLVRKNETKAWFPVQEIQSRATSGTSGDPTNFPLRTGAARSQRRT